MIERGGYMKNNKGYIMTEALIISGIVLAALILIYANFARLNKRISEVNIEKVLRNKKDLLYSI